MKVILVKRKSEEKGMYFYTALCEVAGALEKNGIETEIFQVGAADRRLYRLQCLS